MELFGVAHVFAMLKIMPIVGLAEALRFNRVVEMASRGNVNDTLFLSLMDETHKITTGCFPQATRLPDVNQIIAISSGFFTFVPLDWDMNHILFHSPCAIPETFVIASSELLFCFVENFCFVASVLPGFEVVFLNIPS